MTLNIDVIPESLRNRAQWLIWRFEPNPKKPEGKLLKVPYYANGNRRFGGQGDAKDRAKLVTLDIALAALSRPSSAPYNGIGFAFLPDDGLIGIDIDKCIDPESGEVSAIAQEVIASCQSYTEYSPSKTGVHIIVAGSTRTFKSDAVGVEVFCGSQYFTFTANAYTDVREVVAISDDFLERLRVIVKGERKPDAHRSLPPLPPEAVSELARIEAALSFIPSESYDTWYKVGMALYSTLGDAGFGLWNYWSSKSSKYDGVEACQKKWDSFGKRGVEVTAGTIFHLAKERGWKPPRSWAVALESPAPPIKKRETPSAAETSTTEKEGLSSAALPRGEEVDSEAVETAENQVAKEGDTAPVEGDFAAAVAQIIEDESGLRSLAWALDNCSLIVGSTDVWDSLNNLRFKKSAFISLVGKVTYKEWECHALRKSIKMGVQGVVGGSSAPAAGGTGSDKPAADKKKKPVKEYGDSHWDKVDRLLKNFTLIYGADEVWDNERRMLIKINPLRLAFGNDAVKYWLNNADRKMVPLNKVVFDPTQKSDPETTVNLFNGISMVPRAGDKSDYCLIVDLLRYLCGTDDVFEWVICWLAYAIQNPGAKMVTSIIMHGDEGSGKNLFFEKCIAKIYGEYGGVIGNAEIESQFNEWASKKLFVVCDEVVTKSELRQLKGRLKAMVSNPTININPKNLSSRTEANHMNFVFLSNELQPLALDKTDRRYMVIWTPPKQTEEYYAAVKNEMENGGNEAFYHFLLNLDVGEFNAHTKPLMTQAKKDLIDLGLSPSERFFNEWEAGLLPLPYVCCSAMQLYAAFCRWSYLNGERFPPSQTLFGRTVSRIGFGKVSKGEVKYELMSEVKQRMVYLVGDKPEEKTREKWVADGSDLFEKALQKYRNVYASDDQQDS